MIENTKRLPVLRVNEQGRRKTDAVVVSEFPLTIILDDLELVTLLCSPKDMDCLAVGFLFAEGFIEDKRGIKKIAVDEQRGVARVTRESPAEVDRDILFKRLITSACGRGAGYYSAVDARLAAKVDSRTSITPDDVYSLIEEFNRTSRLFKETGGVHGAALCDTKHILVFCDDVGRHNAVDKVFGKCILEGISTEGRIMISSGRTPSEMILKASNGRTPILISISAPSDLGVRLANDLGVTLIGFVRGRDMTVYTHDWRVTDV
jgi:FdhD protein